MGKYAAQVHCCKDVTEIIPSTDSGKTNLSLYYDCFTIYIIERAALSIVHNDDEWYRPWGNIINQNVYFAIKSKRTKKYGDAPISFQICVYRKSDALKTFVKTIMAPVVNDLLGVQGVLDKHRTYVYWELPLTSKPFDAILSNVVPKLIDIAKRKLGLIK